MAEEPIHFLKDIVREVNSLRDPCTDSFLTPSGLRRMFLLLLRGHWSSPHNHGPDLKGSLACLTWDPDPKARRLDIELQGTDEANKAGDSAIFVKVGAFQFTKVSFGGRLAVSEDNATVDYVYPTTCQALFVHEHPSLDVAFDMAWSTFAFLSGYSEAITQIMGQEATLKPEIVGEPQQVDQAPEGRYRVDFGMAMGVSICLSTTAESHRLKTAFDQFTPIPS